MAPVMKNPDWVLLGAPKVCITEDGNKLCLAEKMYYIRHVFNKKLGGISNFVVGEEQKQGNITYLRFTVS